MLAHPRVGSKVSDVATSTVSAGSRKHSRASTIALKTISAITGLFFVVFIVVHMYGNLKIFSGVEAFNEYAHHLRVIGYPMLPEGGGLWLFRLLLIASLIGHAGAAFILWRRAGKARQVQYAKRRPSYGGFYAKAMRWGGLAILLFVPFHLLHFTTTTIEIGGSDFAGPGEHLVASFGVWWAVLIYVAAVLALGLHLFHGTFGAAMTLGLNTSARAAKNIRVVGLVLSLVITIGFLVPPLGVFFGLVP